MALLCILHVNITFIKNAVLNIKDEHLITFKEKRKKKYF